MPFDKEELAVFSHGFYLLPAQSAPLAFGWECLTQVDRTAEHQIGWSASMASREHHRCLTLSVGADLLFLPREPHWHPNHPDLVQVAQSLAASADGS